ncbi:UDP-glucose iridoid glucosyltransferase [Ziziphus jujuba]|uniref:UDP-glucose iridoid glucosyltransferase n=1 Tax=Ziziphus jujuba TaxID=326968 RepID=A0A6P3ZJS6_ZIZJJ|nr:UDP-glucose iridoid glucosyltransferase [Ziziphus jujuba]
MKKETERRSRRLVLVPCPLQGHINPMLQLGTILESRGFSITIAHTSYNSPNPETHPEFSFLLIPDGLSDRDISSGDLISLVLNINHNCKESLNQLIQQEDPHRKEIACIISDELMYFAEAVAANLKLPSIVLRTTSAATALAWSAVLELKAQGLIPFQDSRSHDLVPKLHPLRFKDLPISIFADFETAAKLAVYSYRNRTSSAVIWNTMDCLEQSRLLQVQQEHKVPIFPIAPMHTIAPHTSGSLLKEDRSCMEWLDKQSHNSVIYVSLGSIAFLSEKEVEEMAWGLDNSEQPFLWVVRPGSISGSDWIELLPQGFRNGVGERGCIVKWAPQKEVLAHEAVGGFWSHCGWNSTLESICEGVPMICRPCFGDQRVNARYVSHEWRIGIELEKLEREEIERAVRKLILGNEGKEMRERAKDLKEKVTVYTREGGSSYNFLNELVNLIMSF